MEKAEKGFIAVAVTRLSSDPVPVQLPERSTVKDALAKAGITTATKAEYFVDGQRAEQNDVLENGDVLAIVTPKQAGA